MTVRKILQHKGDSSVAAISPDAMVSAAVHTMCERRIGCLLVVDSGNRPVGIVSERDCLRAVDRGVGAFGGVKVSEAMTRDVICALPNDSAQYVMHVMTNNKIRHLPVVDEGRVVGLVSIGDVIHYQLEETRLQNRKMHDYLELSGQL